MSTFEYAARVLPHLQERLNANQKVMEELTRSVSPGQSLFAFGSGHSALLAMELFHRAGGPSFLIPITPLFVLPTQGPRVVRAMERLSGLAEVVIDQAAPRAGESLWIFSQSGINSLGIEAALAAQARGVKTVAWSSLVHSQSQKSRHASGKRLFEICDHVVDLGGEVGDASITIREGVKAGPLSSVTSIFLAHCILTEICRRLESQGTPCVYTSVNTADGEKRNQKLEELARQRDPLLR